MTDRVTRAARVMWRLLGVALWLALLVVVLKMLNAPEPEPVAPVDGFEVGGVAHPHGQRLVWLSMKDHAQCVLHDARPAMSPEMSPNRHGYYWILIECADHKPENRVKEGGKKF